MIGDKKVVYQLPFQKLKRRLVQRPFVTADFSHLKKHQDLVQKFKKERPLSELYDKSFVVLNKPQGPTSHQVAAYVKEILGLERTGHTGTLDPNVTGVLPVGLGRATRIIMGLINTGKEYVCYMKLHDDYTPDEIRAVCGEFVGDIEQLPPIKSAIKRELRTRTVYYLDVLEIQGRDVLFRIGCQAGTYIRKVCTDIGEKLGSGGHMQQLVRTKAACFTDSAMFTLDDLRDAVVFAKEGNEAVLRSILQPVERAVSHLRRVYVFNTAARRIIQGAQLMVPGIIMVDENISAQEDVAVYTQFGEFLCLGQALVNGKSMLRKEKGIALKSTRVFLREEEVIGGD